MIPATTVQVLLAPLLAGIATVVTLLVESITPLPPIIMTPEVVEILSHKTLRLYCLLGAIGGGVLAVFLTQTRGTREMAGKWTVGVLSGVLFTPWVLRLTHLSPTIDNVTPVAGTVALLSWGVLHALIPIFERHVIKRTQRMLGDHSDPSTKP